ncbi:hypothetical protein [Candidatus Acidianus copahuensis]|uniref:hypothetical protein n=2 Tax=Acidianus TaxID=12914 RepID=UPI00064E3CA5|nr:hypothetical protein [Candidatus Acidianus copahuensis]
MDEIENMLRIALNEKKSRERTICEEILDKGFIVVERVNKNVHPNLKIIELDGKYLVTFLDTIQILDLFFEKGGANPEDIIPKRLHPFLSYLKRNGLIYYDGKRQKYVFIT